MAKVGSPFAVIELANSATGSRDRHPSNPAAEPKWAAEMSQEIIILSPGRVERKDIRDAVGSNRPATRNDTAVRSLSDAAAAMPGPVT